LLRIIVINWKIKRSYGVETMTIPVSVVIPSYNHEGFIGEAIESVLRQTFEDFELIIIDDHSSDDSVKVIESFSDKRIIFKSRNENLGACATINEALAKARGEYVAILNSDDIYTPERLKYLYSYAKMTKVELLATDLLLIDGEGRLIKDKEHWFNQWYEGLKNRLGKASDLKQVLMAGNLFITTSNFFVKRDVFEQIGCFKDYRYTLDYEFVIRFIATRPSKILFLKEQCLLKYRLHGHNTIREDPVKPNKETLELLIHWLPKFIVDENHDLVNSFREQIEKVSNHIEDETARLCQAAAQKEINDLEFKNKQLLEELNDLRHSKAFLVGKAILTPFYYFKDRKYQYGKKASQ